MATMPFSWTIRNGQNLTAKLAGQDDGKCRRDVYRWSICRWWSANTSARPVRLELLFARAGSIVRPNLFFDEADAVLGKRDKCPGRPRQIRKPVRSHFVTADRRFQRSGDPCKQYAEQHRWLLSGGSIRCYISRCRMRRSQQIW